jgi:hypothetical protein
MIPPGIGNATVGVGDHIAHFYRGEAEMFGVLGPYVAQGITRGDKCAVISSPETADRLREWLASRGLDVAGALKAGQLIFHPGEATVADMQAMFERVEAEALDTGHKFVRLIGDGGWALAGRTSTSEMLRWEALYDQLSRDWQILALCQFDLTRFGGDVVMDALRSHPLTVVGQAVLRNPFYTRPEDLLQELERRG